MPIFWAQLAGGGPGVSLKKGEIASNEEIKKQAYDLGKKSVTK